MYWPIIIITIISTSMYWVPPIIIITLISTIFVTVVTEVGGSAILEGSQWSWLSLFYPARTLPESFLSSLVSCTEPQDPRKDWGADARRYLFFSLPCEEI